MVKVMLDGIPVHEYNHHWLHQSVSIVGQEPTLYARSIRENIIYGLEGESTSGFLYDIDTAPAGRWCVIETPPLPSPGDVFLPYPPLCSALSEEEV